MWDFCWHSRSSLPADASCYSSARFSASLLPAKARLCCAAKSDPERRGSRQMSKLGKWAARIGGYAATLAFALYLFAGSAHAQFGGAAAQQGAQANPLPLSGRSGASGGVATTQTAIPGTTTSVHTLNPTIQISGAYSGS